MRVVLSGGGTGGHIYPALAIGKQCVEQDSNTQLLYIGSQKGLEQKIVTQHGIPFESIEIAGFRRKLFTLHNIKTVQLFWQAVHRSKQLLKEFRPDVVVGTGGFVCGPVVYAAAKLGIPTIIHEQNVIPGLANSFLSRYTDLVAVSFRGSETNFPKAKKVVYTGNPSASMAFAASAERGLEALQLQADSRVVVITGGSRGAKVLNDTMLNMAPLLAEMKDVHFVWVTGESYFEQYHEKWTRSEHAANEHLHIVPYLHNMPDVLAASKLVISRAGASFLAEVAALGIPSILIPSPNVTNNHQEANARWLQAEGAAEMIVERELHAEELFQLVKSIMNDEQRRQEMSAQARKMGEPHSAQIIVNELTQLK